MNTVFRSIGAAVTAAALSFFALSLAASASEPGSQGALEKAFKDYAEAMKDAQKTLRDSPFYNWAGSNSDQDQAEAHQHLGREILAATQAGFFGNDREFPTFQPRVNPQTKIGNDNPDNAYFMTHVNADAAYRITGTRGTSATLVFQTLVGVPGVRGAGTSTEVDSLSADTMVIEPDGTFEIYVAPTNDVGAPNFLMSGSIVDPSTGETLATETILVRYSHMDWDNEQPGQVNISRIENEGLQTPNLDRQTMVERLNEATERLLDSTEFWDAFLQGVVDRFAAFPNNCQLPQPTRGGLVGQFSSFCFFDIPEDHVLIVKSYPSPAAYQGFQLGNLWFESLEYKNRQTSLTAAQSRLTFDSNKCALPGPSGPIPIPACYRYLISDEDIGVHNWLDTEGHVTTTGFLRWQQLPAGVNPLPVLVQVVHKDDAAAEFSPAELVTPAEREAQILARQRHVQKRYGE